MPDRDDRKPTRGIFIGAVILGLLFWWFNPVGWFTTAKNCVDWQPSGSLTGDGSTVPTRPMVLDSGSRC